MSRKDIWTTEEGREMCRHGNQSHSLNVCCPDEFDRHPKWQRVEPGTVIPAGQPYRAEWEEPQGAQAVERTSSYRQTAPPSPEWFIDSSWKPPHPCNAPLNIKGEGFNCDKGWGHALPHGNTEAGAIWDGEQSPTDSPEPTR